MAIYTIIAAAEVWGMGLLSFLQHWLFNPHLMGWNGKVASILFILRGCTCFTSFRYLKIFSISMSKFEKKFTS